MMDMVLAIDCFRLISEPLGSIAVYLSEVVRSLCVLPGVQKLYLVLPRKPRQDFIHNKLVELDNVEFVYPGTEFFPEGNFFSEIYWVHVVVPCIIRQKINSTNYYIAPYHHPPIFLHKGISVVTIIHDLCGLRSDCGYRKTGRGFYEHLFRFLMASIRSDVLIPISYYTKSQLSKSFPFLSSRISPVVHNVVSCQTLNDTAFKNTLRKYNLLQQRYFLGFGSPSLRKGIDLTLDSYRLYRARGGDALLVLIVASQYHHAVNQLVRTRRLKDLVILSDIEAIDRDALYRGAVALLFPSRCEGFGYPVLEAMRQGCPPIAYRNGPIAEIVDSMLPLLAKLDVEEIVTCMRTLEGLDFVSRVDLGDRLIQRSLLFTGDKFGHKFFRAIKEAAYEN